MKLTTIIKHKTEGHVGEQAQSRDLGTKTMLFQLERSMIILRVGKTNPYDGY